MLISNIISPARIACNVQVGSKKRALEIASELLTQDLFTPTQFEVFECLTAREKLGSTSLGYGVALPHGRMKRSDKTIAAFMQLKQGIDYDTIDNQKVDLLFVLLVPDKSTNEHLEILSCLTEIFSNGNIRNDLREAKETQALYKILTQSDE